MAIHRHTLNLNNTAHRDLLAQTPVEFISREPIKAGDTIVICATKHCKAKYYPDSWQSIGKKCRNCGRTDTLKVISVRSSLNFKKGAKQPVKTTSNGSRWFNRTAQLALISLIIFSSIVYYLSRDKEKGYVKDSKSQQTGVAKNYRSPDKPIDAKKLMPGGSAKYIPSQLPNKQVVQPGIEQPPVQEPPNLVSIYGKIVKTVVREYSLEIKVRGTSDLDSDIWKSVLVNPILEQKLQSTCWLRNNGLRYIFRDQNVSITDISFDEHFRRATVLARISEISGIKKKSNGQMRSRMRRYDYRAIYKLKRINQDWRIYCLQALKEGEPNTCRVKLSGQDSCR